MKIKIFLLTAFVMFLYVQCNEDKHQSLTSQRLVLMDGLLYSDSLSDTPYTGKYFSVYQNKKIEFEVKNGLKEGKFKLFFENGRLEIEGTLANSKNNGEWRYYYSDGMLQSKGNFRNDTLTGKWYWFHKNGAISESGVFTNGLRDGEWQSLNSSGVLQFTRIYKSGIAIDSINHLKK